MKEITKRYGKDFGEKIKQLRIAQGDSLRSFSEKSGFDAGNLSKIERGILPPPTDISKYLEAFNIKENSVEALELKDIASKSLATTEFVNVSDEVAERLPQFFRTLDNSQLTKEKLEKLLKYLKEN